MAQRPKEEVRERIVAAAAEAFADRGYPATTIGDVAAVAGVSTGNVYRYFEGKGQLLAAVVPAAFVEEVTRRTREKVQALGAVRDVRLLAQDARYHVLSGELLDLCLRHRAQVVILLGRAAGTPYAGFADEFRDGLVALALDYVRVAWPSLRVSPQVRFALHEIYANFFRAIANAFAAFREPETIREAVFHLTSHHQGGLKHLFERAAQGEHHEPSVRSHADAVTSRAPGADPGVERAARRGTGAAAPRPRARHRRGRPRGRG